MSDEEEDPVVTEVDVFLSRQLADSLLLLQYPVRPASLSYSQLPHLGTRIKPKQNKIEIEVGLDTSSANYAKSKGEQIAINVDGGEGGYFHSSVMDKQVLVSTPAGISTARYAVGALKDGEFHLTPLKGIVQMRPSFSYLDKVDVKKKLEAAVAEGGESSQEEDEAKQVMVKFARHETEDAKARRMASFEYMKRKQEEEPWVNVQHHLENDPMSEVERSLLFARQSVEVSEFQVTPDEYLQKLIPRVEEQEDSKPRLPSNVLSMTELKTMTIGDQIRALLINAKVIRFSQLLSLLPKTTDTTSALRLLQQVALLVQGCWVVKSDVLYPKDSMSGFTGVPAEILCRGRDYIMWRFTQSRCLVRKDISSVIRLPAEDVKDILEQMSAAKVSRGWEFLMDYDTEFVHRHPDVIQRQQMLWDTKFQTLSKVLNISKADIKLADKAQAAAASMSPKRRRTVSRSRTKSGGEQSMSDLSDTDTKTDRQRHGSGSRRRRNSSGPVSRQQRLLSGASDSVAMDTNHVDNGLAQNSVVMQQGHVTVQPIKIKAEPCDNKAAGDGIINSTPRQVNEVELKKTLISFVSEKMSQRYILTIKDLRQLLTLRLTESLPGHILGTGISDKMLEQTMYEIGAVRYNQTPTQGDHLFVLTKFGDSFDSYRAAMMELFEIKPMVRISVLKKKIEENGLELPSDAELKKMLKDYSVCRGGAWHLKGFVDS